MENIQDIRFNDDGTHTITFNDGVVKSYAEVPATAPQTVTLAPGQTLVVTAQEQSA